MKRDEKKLTDEEIVRALECCSLSIPICERCCFSKQCGDGENILPTILDLINRQKAEIERYKGVIKILESDVATAKSEAIKEFADRFVEEASVKTKVLGCCHYSKNYEISKKNFDKLLKKW